MIRISNIPGIGRLVDDAISKRDYPIIQGVILIFSGVYVLVNLAVDLSYPVLDPRIRYCAPSPQNPRLSPRPAARAARNCGALCGAIRPSWRAEPFSD